MRFPIVEQRNLWYGISATMLILSVASIAIFGFNLSLHFTGGLEIKYTFAENTPQASTLKETIVAHQTTFNNNAGDGVKIDIGNPVVVSSGERDLNVRIRMTDSADQSVQNAFASFKESLSTKIEQDMGGTELSSQTISPSVGQTLKEQSLWATLFAVLAIMLYVVFAFWKLPKNYNPWIFGFNVIAALAHDIVILCGIFAALGAFFNVEVGPYFITALLTVLGYSVNDTIVVFDRVRENFAQNPKASLEDTTEESIWQTMARSINTSLTLIITLGALLFLGAPSTQTFALALFLGVIVGTYSSIFVAAPLLVTFKNYLLRK